MNKKIILPAWKQVSIYRNEQKEHFDSLVFNINLNLYKIPNFTEIYDNSENFYRYIHDNANKFLTHPLSSYIRYKDTNHSKEICREIAEAQLYQKWASTAPEIISFDEICTINAIVTHKRAQLRRSEAYLASPNGDVCIPMMDWRKAHQRLLELPKLLETGEFGHGLLAAVRTMVYINNVHGFTDGNGRLGRFLFNHLLRLSGMSINSYIPLKLFSIKSRGGYEIRINEAILYSKWNGIVLYHINIINLINKWNKYIHIR